MSPTPRRGSRTCSSTCCSRARRSTSRCEIDQIFDGMGAELNAGTGKETTSVYARVSTSTSSRPSTSWPTWCSGLRSPTSTPSARSSWRRSPCTRTTPRRRSLTCSARRCSGTTPWVGPSSGAPRSSRTPRPPTSRAFTRPLPAPERGHRRRRRRRPRRARRSGARALHCAGASQRRRSAAAATALAALAARRPVRRFERKDTEQYHVCLGGTGLSRHDDRRFALRVLDTIFGGTSSSRLFQEVRERRDWRTRCTRSPAPTPTPARWASTWAPGPTTWSRPVGGRHRARTLSL